MSTQPLSTTDLLALVRSGQELSAQVGLDALLARILGTVSALTDSPDTSIILRETSRDALYFAAATGDKAPYLLEEWGLHGRRRVPMESAAGEVFATGATKVIGAADDDDSHFSGVDHNTRKKTAALVCAPLAVDGRRLGVMQILNKRSGRYDERDRVLIEHFATQAAIAIRNAQWFERLLVHMGLYTARPAGQPLQELFDELDRPARIETLTVMFADMRAFTQLCQVVDSVQRAQELLNEFLSMLAREVLAGGGIVNKFMGDGMLALFRGPRHAEDAVRCAFAIVEAFDALRQSWDERSNVALDFVDVGIGLATDAVVLGAVGGEQIRDFTVVGTAVNLASYLEQQARDGHRILADRMTFRGARELIASFDGPRSFELKKPGQTVGRPFERYELKQLAAGPGADAGRTLPPGLRGRARTGVFISYSHRDKPWLERLNTHLRPYLRSGALATWDDTRIKPGDDWRQEIVRALTGAQVAVLLVSPHFLESEFIASNELPPLLEAAERGGLRVIWVPVSASSYDVTGIERYQAAFDPSRPLDACTEPEQNRMLVGLCREIKAATL